MAYNKLLVFSALLLITINLRSSEAALECYRCMGCEDLSEFAPEVCGTVQTTTEAPASAGQQQAQARGIGVDKDDVVGESTNRAVDGWWCYSEMMIHEEMEHIDRGCTDNEHFCHESENSDCKLCDTDGCNAASNIIMSTITLTAMLILARFL